MSLVIHEAFTVQASPDRVFAFLNNPADVVTCLPGAELTESIDARTHMGRVRVKVGPVSTSYAGKAILSEVDPALRRVTITGEGKESGGSGSARLHMVAVATATADGSTSVTVDATIDIAGRIMQFGRGLIESVSKQLFQQFVVAARDKLERAAQQVANTYLEAPVRTALADVFRAQGQVAEAVKAYSAVIRNDARYVRAYLGLASLYAEANNMQQAAHMMREVLDIDPFHRTDHFYFTDYPETARDTEVYRPAWGKVKPGENDKSIVLSSEGITAFHAEQYDEAETLLRRALADDRNNLAAHMYLGAVQLTRKRGKDAVTSLQQANRINNLHTRTNYLLARALALAGDAEKAEKKFGEVREADANFVAALNALGEMALKRGEDEKARDAFLDAFKADADYTPAKANLLRTNH